MFVYLFPSLRSCIYLYLKFYFCTHITKLSSSHSILYTKAMVLNKCYDPAKNFPLAPRLCSSTWISKLRILYITLMGPSSFQYYIHTSNQENRIALKVSLMKRLLASPYYSLMLLPFTQLIFMTLFLYSHILSVTACPRYTYLTLVSSTLLSYFNFLGALCNIVRCCYIL